MNPLSKPPQPEFSAAQAAQRCSRPELFVVAASRVQRDTQARLPDPVSKMIDIMWQVETPALFARLDNHDASRMRNRLRLQRSDRAETREHRVAVVGAAAAIKTIALEHRSPRTETLSPSRHLGLLVHVAVKQHAIFGVARNIGKQQRRASREPHDFTSHSLERFPSRPIFEARNPPPYVPLV